MVARAQQACSRIDVLCAGRRNPSGTEASCSPAALRSKRVRWSSDEACIEDEITRSSATIRANTRHVYRL